MRRQLFFKAMVLTVSALLCAGPSVWAQDMDYNADQYAEYERVIGIKDPVERADAILTFMREHKGLSLVDYALKNYGELLEQFRTGDRAAFANYLKYAEKLMEIRPELAKDLTLNMALSAYQIQDTDSAIKYAEKAYADAPSSSLALLLTNSYATKDDQVNSLKYAEIALSSLEAGDPEFTNIAVRLRARAIEKKDFTKAAGYANSVLKSLDALQKPASVSDADWQNYVQGERSVSQLIVARSFYESEKYPEAIKQFEKISSSKSYPNNFRSEAYYYIGLSHWRQSALDPAMRAFALGSVLKAAHSEACEKNLVMLYKSTHNDSTAGLDEYLERIIKAGP